MKTNANKIDDIQFIVRLHYLDVFDEVKIFLGYMGTYWEQYTIFALEL